jgi:hypothetical protein
LEAMADSTADGDTSIVFFVQGKSLSETCDIETTKEAAAETSVDDILYALSELVQLDPEQSYLALDGHILAKSMLGHEFGLSVISLLFIYYIHIYLNSGWN